MLNRYIILILFLFSSLDTFAQKITIDGTVTESFSGTKLPYAVIMAIHLNDSVLVSFTRSNNEGVFRIENLPLDTYQVIISHPQSGDQSIIILGDSANTDIHLGNISLPGKSVSLREVTIHGYSDAVYYKGDTLVYTADSFKVKQNAVVEDLLKKLPGIKVDAQGKIFSEGKAIDQLLVDGDEFFGSDPTIATKNLNARSVESVEVYEKKNDGKTENSDSETLKIMNLKLKEDAKKGYFGKISGASDFEKFNEGQVLLNKFRGSQKISAFLLYSNTPNSGFDWNDMNEYGLRGEMNSFSGDDGMMHTYYGNDPSKGIPEVTKTGFYFTDKINSKTKLTSNYSFNRLIASQNSSTAYQYFFPDTSYQSNRNSSSHSQRENHNLNFNLTHTVDSMTEIEIQSRSKFNLTSQDASEMHSFYTLEDTVTRSTISNNRSKYNNRELNNSVKLIQSFGIRDRKFVMEYGLNVLHAVGDGFLLTREIVYSVTDSVSQTDQEKNSVNDKTVHSAFVEYTEPMSKKIKLEFSYDMNLTNGRQFKKTLDFFNGSYSEENPALTNEFENERNIYRVGLKFIYEDRKQTLTVGSRVRQVNVINTNLEEEIMVRQQVRNALPFFTFRYKFTDNQSVNFRYNTNVREPDINQLQPVPDNTNPNYIVKGNSSLQSSFTHNFSLGFNSFKPISGKYIYSNGNFSFIENAFSNSIQYDSLGRTISQPVNVQGNHRTNFYMGLTLPFFSRVFEVNPYLSFFESTSTNFINNGKNKSNQYNFTGNLNLIVRYDTLEFSIGGGYTYNNSSSTLSTESKLNYITYGYNASLSTDMPGKFEFRTDVDYTRNDRRAQAYNIRYLLWNASLSKKLLKNDNLIISLEASDILNQNVSTYREIQENIISDIKTTIIGRYMLFRVIFKFNNKPDKEANED